MYNYRESVREDILSYISENVNLKDYNSKIDAYESLYDDMFVSDSITGNASGSYTFSTYQAEENLVGNKDLLIDALNEFGGDYKEALLSAEYSDVTIRCYLLSELLYEVLDDFDSEGMWDEEEEEE